MFGKDAGERLLKYRNAEPHLFSTPVYYVLGTVIRFLMLLFTSWCLQIAVFSTQNLRARILIHVILGCNLLTNSHITCIMLLIFRRPKKFYSNCITVKSGLMHYPVRTQSWSNGF